MRGNDSCSKSWAEQWDYGNEDQTSPINQGIKNKNKNNGNGNGNGKSLTKKYSKKLGQSFNKTKEVATNGMDKTKESVSSGMKKVKDGASGGFSWIKHKFSKSSDK